LWGRFAPWVSHVHGDRGTEYQGVLKAGSTIGNFYRRFFSEIFQNTLKTWEKSGFVESPVCETEPAEGFENVGVFGIVGARFTVGYVDSCGPGASGVPEWMSFPRRRESRVRCERGGLTVPAGPVPRTRIAFVYRVIR